MLSFLPLADIGGGDMNDCWGWTDPQTLKEYALAGRTSGTSFIDISNPTNPVYLGNLATHSVASSWRDIKVYKDHAYIVADNAGSHGIQVFNLTQLRAVTNPPVSFSETAHYGGFGSAHNIVINEDSGFAYGVGVSSVGNSCAGGLHAVNIQNPTNPVFAGCFSADGYTHDAQCVTYAGPDTNYTGREICFACNEDSVTVVDFTDKGAPVQLSRNTYSGSSYTHQGWLTDDHRYFMANDEGDEQSFGHDTRTHLWDASSLTNPTYIGFYEHGTASYDHNLYVKSNMAYEANYSSGLRLLDISDIENTNLVVAAYFDTYPSNDGQGYNGAWSVHPYFDSGVVIVSDIEQGLFVLLPNASNAPIANLSIKLSDDEDPLRTTNRIRYYICVTNNDAAVVAEVSITDWLPIGLKLIDQVDDDNLPTGFGGGMTANVAWDASNQWLALAGVAVGAFTSRVIDAGIVADWDTLSWVPYLPYGKEFRDSGFADFGYPGLEEETSQRPDIIILHHPDEGGFGKGRSGVTFLMHLNDEPATNGAVIEESSGLDNSGLLVTGEGVVDKAVTGKFFTAINFDGTDDHVTTSNSVFVADSSNQAHTALAWVKTAVGGTIVSQSNGGSSNDFWLGIVSNRLMYAKNRGITITSTQMIADSAWHHVGFVRQADGDVALFIDGKKDGTGFDPYAYADGGLWIGAQSTGLVHYSGCLDEVAIFAVELDEDDVYKAYLRGVLDLQFQVRSCDDVNCAGESFIGPDGTDKTFYSEAMNNSETPPVPVISNVAPNRFFQYRVLFETEDTNASPQLVSVAAGPEHYDPQFGTITASQGTCSGTNPVVCDLGVISTGQSVVVTVEITVPPVPGVLTNRASVDGNSFDFVPQDDSGLETTVIADLDGDSQPDFADPDDDGDGMPDIWENDYGFDSTNGGDGLLDFDLDELLNLHEFIAVTDPTNANSVFTVDAVVFSNPVVIVFESHTSRVYTLEYRDDLLQGVWTNIPDQLNIPGSGGTDSLQDTNSSAARFYRVGVGLP